MGRITLITGGARSGKSRFALELAARAPGPRVFIATALPTDPEMALRIDRHKAERDQTGWVTVESAVDLQAAISDQADEAVLVVDCLTLWVNNLMYQAEQAGSPLEESSFEAVCEGLVDAARDRGAGTVFVTNEVGMGIVPDNPLARAFRDLAGRCNQRLAASADRVVLMVSGLPVEIKPGRQSDGHSGRDG